MKIIKLAFGIIVFAISTSSWAFMPVIGLWNVTNEVNGQPGRGMMIEVRNESLFLTYFGYRPDGSSVKYNASGPLINSSFTGDLVEYEGGPVIGGIYHPASLKGSIGSVSLHFTSGTHGTLTLPGDTPRAISKNALWATENPDGLLGTWVFTQIIGTTPFVQRKTLTGTASASSSTGNGLAFTAAYDFACEFQISGILAGQVVCTDSPRTSGANGYVFKFSGDRGTGVSSFILSTGNTSSYYESDAIRTATKTGARTGLNNGTLTSVQIMSTVRRPMSISVAPPDLLTVQAKESADANSTSSVLDDPAKAAALAEWAAEVHILIAPN